ncbi:MULTISPECIES: hypothetical protein [Oceanobacillus]|uniref:Uncharacterized protein n=1 Tax=Oceanobacillus kimchii TaxID=746691 RepID=A0ABQ5TNC5_9BACI|nr:hypothetical protein [Oceanobacillus kimchii]GLO68313.1 hypothetical protein MACH08_40970 [Oceanobacillus kimchii]
MNKWLKIGCLVFIGFLLLITILYYINDGALDYEEVSVSANQPNHHHHELDVHFPSEYENDPEKLEEYGIDISGYSHHHHEETNENTAPKKGAVEYFFSSIKSNDIDGFFNSFETTILSNDLFQFEEPDKYIVAEKLMNRISRDNTIDSVQYAEQENSLNNHDSDVVKVIINYDDGVEVSIDLQLSMFESNHSHDGIEDENYYLISTSPVKIIKHIENSFQE